MDPEHLDELERRGDSVLDEEDFKRGRFYREANESGGPWHLRVAGSRLWVRLGRRGGNGIRRMSFDEARQFANAILSEIEIATRGEEIE